LPIHSTTHTPHPQLQQILDLLTGATPALGDCGERYFQEDFLELDTEHLYAERALVRLRLTVTSARAGAADPNQWWWIQRLAAIETELMRRQEARRHGRR
jgi:hypothetical protein